jgi:hypothetical protein
MKDKARGEKGESLVFELFTEAGFECSKSPPKTKGWDILLAKNGKSYKCEVKYDYMASQTGNIAIEYWNSKRDEPSGLSATSADFWLTIIGGEIYSISVSDLRYFVKAVMPTRQLNSVGDGNADIFLYKIEQIEPYWKLLTTDNVGDVINAN